MCSCKIKHACHSQVHAVQLSLHLSLPELLFRSFLPWQLIQSPVTTPLGLIMLKTTSEELACPREDLSVARKEELRKLLLDQVQTVLGLLTGETEALLQVHGCRCGQAASLGHTAAETAEHINEETENGGP